MLGRLHVITDDTIQNRYTHVRLAELAIFGGADVIQFRSKSSDVRAMIEEASRIREACRASGVTFLVNDRVDVALAVGADGVHLGKQDMPVHLARSLMGPDAIIGGTARGVDDALETEREGASYVGLGPVFATSTKNVGHEPIGIETVREVTSRLSIPVIAIAGISLSNAQTVIAAGAWGVAVIGAVALADDPVAATRELSNGIRAASIAVRR